MEGLARLGNDVTVWGRNAIIGTAFEELYAYDQAMDWATQFPTAAALDIGSSSVADVMTSGTGAWQVRVTGMDDNFKIVTETINLNGQTKLTGSVLFRRVFGADVIAAGTGLVNAGDIHIVRTGTGGTWASGVPPTLTSAACKILIGWGASWNGMFTTPAGMRYDLKALLGACRAQACTLIVEELELGAASKSKRVVWCADLQPSSWQYDLEKFKISFNEKTDVRLRILAAAASGIAHCQMVLKRSSP